MPYLDNKEKQKVWFREGRHVEEIQGAALETYKNKDDWRKIRERMKTVSVALVFCLNIGVDPPDNPRPIPCARKEAWVDPSTSNPQRSALKIAQNLQKIYEKLQPRARYKSAVDPTVDCIRKLCTSMRRNAKDERVLFHFNGHGVPKPTDAGEIWVFNKNITQYIPLSLYDLQSWMGVPSVYLWDCNSAGTIVNMFMRFAEDHAFRWMEDYQAMREREQQQQQQRTQFYHPAPAGPSTSGENNVNVMRDQTEDVASNASNNSHSIPSYKQNCIQLGACAPGEVLPFQNADLPADLFTCCLTTPIQTSLLCHMLKLGVKNRFPPNIIEDLPGILTDRRTLLGELNWIFTAITDTIAWSCLPMDAFQKLFRQDLLIASLFRSFLLAQRVMRENGCRVVSSPELPSVHAHPLWDYWDYVLDMCVANMYNYNLLQPKFNIIQFTRNDCFRGSLLRHNLLIELSVGALTDSEYAYSWFFIEQLQAFEIWLKFAVDKKEPPQQLPIVLQVLLSQIHRVRALELLARFVDLAPWAVVSALSVGIFPYVLKLLQCGTKELRPALAFIWAKVLAIDPACQHELVKDDGYFYFLHILNDSSVSPRMKIVSAFVMATIICNNYRPAQEKLVQSDYVSLCIELLSNQQIIQCRMLCLWLLIGLGRLWTECDKARWQAIRSVAYDKVIEFLNNDVPEVRAAAVYALGCFVHNSSRNNEHAAAVGNEVCDKLCEKCTYDGSVLVRAELAAAIQWFIIDFQSRFAAICIELDRRNAVNLNHKLNNGTLPRSNNPKARAKLSISSSISPREGNPLDGMAASTTNDSSIQKSSSRHIRSIGSSVYSILPRSASVLNPSNYRDRRSPPPAAAAARKASTLSTGSGTTLASDAGGSLFKFRVLSHIRTLESKTFIGPFERIWLCVLRLGLDPFHCVANMGEKIIAYIMDLSAKINEARNRALAISEHENQQRTISGNSEASNPADIQLNSCTSAVGGGAARGGGRFSSSSDSDQQQNRANKINLPPVRFLVGSPATANVSPSSSTNTAILVAHVGQQHQHSGNNPGGAGDNNTSLQQQQLPRQPECSASSSTATATAILHTIPSATIVGQEHPSQHLSIPQNQPPPASTSSMDNAKKRLLMDPFIHHNLYTPKRSIFGTKSGAYSQVKNDISDALLAEEAAAIASVGLVRTAFVDWCAKTWTEPIYTTIYDDRDTTTRNSLVNSSTPFTVEQPTDWAIHSNEGIRQRARKEIELLKNKQLRCEQQCMKLRLDRPANSMAWSFLRPYVYMSNGDKVLLYSYSTGDLPQQQRHQQPALPPPSMLCCEWRITGEPFLQDPVVDLMVANGLSHELLVTGTKDGLLKVWDPMFSGHSHEQLDQPKMITATYLLSDQPRLGKVNRTFYHWDQEMGRMICSGNVRICRVWDAWAEKSMLDIALKGSKGALLTVASDLSQNLISCGFSDGTLAVYDPRLPAGECEIMHLRDSSAPVVGMGILNERQRVLVGTKDGFVRLWEPRMFQEPVSEFRASADEMSGQHQPNTGDGTNVLVQMEVQRNGQVIACAFANSTVNLYDIDGREGVLSRVRYPAPATGGGGLFASTSSAVSGFSSVFFRHSAAARHRTSSGGSSDSMGSGGTNANPLSSSGQRQQPHRPHSSFSLTAMRFHQSRMLLGVATQEGQFRAFSMPNVDGKQ